MVLVGGGLLLPLVWPLKAAPPSATLAVSPSVPMRAFAPSATTGDCVQTLSADPSGDALAACFTPAPIESEAAASLPKPTLRAIYTWTGNGADDNWDTAGNWSSAVAGHPDDCTDNALIPSGSWDVALIAEQISDLEISGNVDFSGSQQTPPILKADSITLSGSSAITLTFTSTCTLKTFSCP